MLTRISGLTESQVEVASLNSAVKVIVDSDAVSLPNGPLSREEVHDALIAVEEATHEFLAKVESDLEATKPH